MRIIPFCIALLVILFIGHSMYDRVMAGRKLTQAVDMLPNNPMGAYQTIKEVLGYNRMVALGKIGDVEQVFLKSLQDKTVERLAWAPPPAEIYPAVEQAMTVLDQLTHQTRVNVHAQRLAILKAARDSVPVVRDRGTLKAWDNMITMYQNLSTCTSALSEVHEDFNKWFDEVKAVARRPIGLRDAVRLASEAFGQALGQIQLRAAGPSEKPLVTAPANLSDDKLIEAEKAFARAQESIDGHNGSFTALFGEQEIPPELCGLYAKIKFNRAALKLAHFQDRRETIYQTGSDFMTEFLVNDRTDEVPTASEMVGAWQQSAFGDYQMAERCFARASMDDALRRAYAALAIWSEGELTVILNNANPVQYRTRALQMVQGFGGPAAEILRTAQASKHALLIVEVP